MSKLTVDLSLAIEIHHCAKCHSLDDVCRHHKGHDSFIGRFNRKVDRDYKRYLDSVHLCHECHCIIHFNYLPIIKRHKDFSPAGALRLRQKLIHLCNQWLTGKVKLKVPTDEFRRNFNLSYRAWQMGQKIRESQKYRTK